MWTEKTAEKIVSSLGFIFFASMIGLSILPEGLISVRTYYTIIFSIAGLGIIASINVILMKKGAEKKQILITLGLTLMYIMWRASK